MQAARKLDYYEPRQERTASLETAPRQSSQRKAKPRTSSFALQAVFCALVVFCAVIFILVRYSAIAELKVQVYQLNTEAKKLELTRDELQASLNKGLDLEGIERTAIEKLGMQYPSQTQMVYIANSALYTLNESEDAPAGETGGKVRRLMGSLPWFAEKQAMAPVAQ